MSNQQAIELNGRPVGGTEYSWCRAVVGGTGIAVVALQTSKNPDTSNFQNALHKLQTTHPLLRSRLHSNPSATDTFSFVTSQFPVVQVKTFNSSLTFDIFDDFLNSKNQSVSPLHLILEHELNNNAWCIPNRSCDRINMFFASVYALPNAKWVVVLRLHVAACDRTTAVSLLRELLVLVGDEERGGIQKEIGSKGDVSLGIEDLIPRGKSKKSLWTRGVDMLSYSVNSLRLTNLKFNDARSPRSSQVVRLQMNRDDTEKILTACKSRGIKLCSALAAAGLIATHGSKCQSKKYGVVTLIDCRSLLEPPLSTHHFGFYHSAILNTHVMKGGENLWDLAQKMYLAFANYKKCNRHFSDMADLNFLMCKAIENPGLTLSSSLRTSFMSVFEDTVIDTSSEMQRKVGLEDYMGCASVHGIGPSIAVFDTVRDGRLDCACVYPAPLHSREQMVKLVDNMKTVLIGE
ncbi:hypothetical protein CFOL_v3_12938 [Cephalotus follicularis]|uniref:Condensation domain-containing protein n=1 Tax=Cephalotus follicularis TaxID=3775 RepID=A0A1Q3BN19_CEPFO|nr:hypothetical protein CFOL_v3_12938 [Cephalotus follicularis]